MNFEEFLEAAPTMDWFIQHGNIRREIVRAGKLCRECPITAMFNDQASEKELVLRCDEPMKYGQILGLELGVVNTIIDAADSETNNPEARAAMLRALNLQEAQL